MLRNVSLQTKLLMLVTSVTLLLMAVVVAFFMTSLRQSVEEAYFSQLKGITTAINGRYEESHSTEDVQQIFDYISIKDANVLRLTLSGSDGTILASTERSLIGGKTTSDVQPALRDSKQVVQRMESDDDGIPKVLLMAPLREDGRTVGVIELLLNSSDESLLVEKKTLLIILFGLCVSLILLASLWFIIRFLLVKPLMRLRDAAVSVKQGKKYENLKRARSQEINVVYDAFNDMVDNLENRYNELQRALETLQKTQSQLVESEKMVALGSLVAGVAHEINTPVGIGVTAISFLEQKTKDFLSLYRENAMKRSDLDQYFNTIDESTKIIYTNLVRASELIRSFKQVAVDQSSEAKRLIHVKTYIEEVIVSLSPKLKKTKHHVTVQGSGNLEVYSYPGAISQTITNLLMNSLIHAYDTDDQGAISIRIDRQDDRVTLIYSDDGKGMSGPVRERIFDPFFTTNRGGGGTGLGMNIVYSIVTGTLNGTIRCESAEGEGTTFVIDFPIEENGTYE